MGIPTFVIVLLVHLGCCCCCLVRTTVSVVRQGSTRHGNTHLCHCTVGTSGLLLMLSCTYHGQCFQTGFFLSDMGIPTFVIAGSAVGKSGMLLLLPPVLLVSLGCCCCSLLYHGQCCKTELYPTWEYPHLALPAVLLVSLGCCCSLITKLVYLGFGWLSFLTASCCVLYDAPKRIISTIVWSAKKRRKDTFFPPSIPFPR